MRKIKAISIHQPWAQYIADGLKTIETRMRPTSIRGELLICSTKKIDKGRPKSFRKLRYGTALAIVDLYDCRLMTHKDQEAAMCVWEKGRWSWFIKLIGVIDHPYPVTGRQGFYYVELPNALETTKPK